MHFDSLTLCAVRQELQSALVGGRIDKLFQPSDTSLALLVRSGGHNHQLLLSAHPQWARVHLVTAWRLTSGFETPSAFVMLLRKYCEGARIEALEQPSHERILRIDIRQFRDGSPRPSTLIIEVMGRRSNILLVTRDDGILGLLKRVTPTMSRERPLHVHGTYRLPPLPLMAPPGEPDRPKLAPEMLTGGDLSIMPTVNDGTQSLAQALVATVAGVSPTFAKELAFRAVGRADAHAFVLRDAAVASEVARLVREYFGRCSSGAWEPRLAVADGKPVAFAPYELRGMAPTSLVQPLSSISLAVDRYFAAREQSGAVVAIKQKLLGPLRDARKRLSALRAALQHEIDEARKDEPLRVRGELLLAYQPDTKGRREVEVPGEDGSPFAIAVDPLLTATENAQRLFKRYRKARTALKVLPDRLGVTQAELAFVNQAETDVAMAETREELRALDAELKSATSDRTRAIAPAPAKQRNGARSRRPQKGNATSPTETIPPRSAQVGGFALLIGRNSRQNDELTFRTASRHDLWLHARQVPGSHVIIRRDTPSAVPDSVLTAAASAAAYYSANREAVSVPVDVTEVANVRRMPGGKPGMVVYTGERTLTVRPTPL